MVDAVAATFHPTPVIRHVEHVGDHGPMVELVVLAAENTAGGYTRLDRSLALRRLKADRAALAKAGAFSTAEIAQRLDRKTSPTGAIALAELVRLFPHRDWFSDDSKLGPQLGRAIAQHLLTLDDPPHWLIHWAKDLPRVRLELAAAYRDLVKRDVARDHRARVGEVIAKQLTDRKQRRTVEQWFEEHTARIAAGGTVFEVPIADADHARRRACAALGGEIGPVLAAEGEKATAQYTAALRSVVGARGETVLHVGGLASAVDWQTLADTGIKQVMLSGTGEGDGPAITVSDPLERAGVRELMAMWARGETLSNASADTVVRRAIESGAHLPILGFIRTFDRPRVEKLVAAIERDRVGHKQARRSTLADLRRVLDAPTVTTVSPGLDALREYIASEDVDLTVLKAAAKAALTDPRAARELLSTDFSSVAFVRQGAGPNRTSQWRRPCLVLCGLVGDKRLLEWWVEETDHQIRISLIEAIGLMAPGDETDAALHQALESRAGVAKAAAVALASRGQEGYEVLHERMPVDTTLRKYVLDGVAIVASQNPTAARTLAAAGCDGTPASQVYAAARQIDATLHLHEARMACARAVTEAA